MSGHKTFRGGMKFGGDALRGFALSGIDAIGREAGLIALQALIEKVTNPEGLSQFEKVINNCIYKPQLSVCVGEFLLWFSHCFRFAYNLERADVAGLDQVIIDLERKALGPLLFPEKYVGYSRLLAAPKGILLHGPPGTGKTMLAKMIANNSGIALINISSSTLVSKFSGESEKMIDALFSTAKRLEPCIIFIDEIDSILGKRSGGEASHTTSFKAE
jgi:ATP-dependent 26S proteasome regulatory subunit